LVQFDSAAADSAIAIGAAGSGDVAITYASLANGANAVSDMTATGVEAAWEATLRYSITGTAAANTITTGGLDDTITGGAGADVLNGGAGADTFVVAAGDSTVAASDSISAWGATDVINHAVDLSIGGDALTAAAAGNAQIAATGKATFHADDDTLAERIAAVAADLNGANANTAGKVAFFEHGGNTYVFITDATGGNTTGDDLITLVGVTGLTTITVTGGNITVG
jgi:S-layer protein